MPRIQIKRGTKSQLDTAASNSQLYQGEPYLITDSESMGVALANNRYVEMSSLLNVAMSRTYYYIDTPNGFWNPLYVVNDMVDFVLAEDAQYSGTLGRPVFPFYVGEKLPITKIGIYVSGISGSTDANIAIYSSYQNQRYLGLPHPYQKLADVYIPTFNTTGLKSVDFNFIFYPNRVYWLGLRMPFQAVIKRVKTKKYLTKIAYGLFYFENGFTCYRVDANPSFPDTINIGSVSLDSEINIPLMLGLRTSE
jgi:hypothetical protein